jgi:hypothetical protein
MPSRDIVEILHQLILLHLNEVRLKKELQICIDNKTRAKTQSLAIETEER